MFGTKYIYCAVRFDSERTYWYRTNERGLCEGMKVIVPISDNGLWKIGTITETKAVTARNLPYPLDKTKGIVETAGMFAESRVEKHNRQIQQSKYPPVDISVAYIGTKQGRIKYITCARERELLRKRAESSDKKPVIIENYPAAREKDIPPEALKLLEMRLKNM